MLRKLNGVEHFFSSPNHQENVLLGIKFTDSKYVKKTAENFKKIFSGLRLCIKNGHYYRKEKKNNIPIYQIPNWIQDCKEANRWAFDNCTLPLTEGLATIAANDRIIVINSSHNLSDGGFMVSALKHCLDDMLSEKINKEPPILSNDVFQKDIQEIDSKFDPKNICSMSKLTTCKYDPNDSHLATPGTRFIDFAGVIPIKELGTYNISLQRPQYLTEIQSVAIAASIAALNRVSNGAKFTYDDPLALSTVLDMRKFADDESGFNWSHGNFVVKSPIHANISKSIIIESICKKFRKSIKLLQPEGSFYTTKHVLDFINTPPASIFGCLSSIGPIEFKRPIVDIDIEDCWLSKEGTGDHGENFGSQFTIVSYSKNSEYRNDFCYFTRFPPASMTFENGKLLSESFNHFLRNVSLSMKFDDALNELISFQNSLKKII